jgi:hypothetical protein
MWRLAALWLVLAQLASVASARATPPDDERLIQTGIELRRAGRDADALAVFVRALAIRESPRAKAQVGFAHHALGHWIEAERDLAGVLAAPRDTWTEQHLDTLESALAAVRTHLAWLEVEANIPGAELRIDGVAAGTLPLAAPVRVVAGTVTIDVNAAGFVPQLRSVHIEPGMRAREVMALVKGSASVDALPSTQPHPAALDAAVLQTPTDVPAAPEGHATLRTAAWISLATAIAFGASGGTAVVLRESNAAMYNDDSRCFYGALTRDQRCGRYRDSAATAQALATLGLGAATAAAVTSAVLFVVSSPTRGGVDHAGLRCAPLVGVACTMSF